MIQESNGALLSVRHLVKEFNLTPGILRYVAGSRILRAVDDVSFDLPEESTLGLVGESGCGKSTTARLITRLVPATSGRVFFRSVDILSLASKDVRLMRKAIQIVFQDPFSSLNPRKKILETIGRPLAIHMGLNGTALIERVAELLDAVGLKSDHLYRYPHEFSGGQRQRIAIARALASEPELLVADEPVSSLDVSVQAQILNLFISLKEKRRFSVIFISHDLSVVEHVSDRIAVMYAGKIVERAATTDFFGHPLHPYSQILLAAHLEPDPRRKPNPIEIRGEPFIPINPPPGCRFASRCPLADQECLEVEPQLEEKEPARWVACHKIGRTTVINSTVT